MRYIRELPRRILHRVIRDGQPFTESLESYRNALCARARTSGSILAADGYRVLAGRWRRPVSARQ